MFLDSSAKVKLRVSYNVWKNFEPSEHLPDPANQSLIVPYLEQCSRDQLTISNLLQANKDLMATIVQNNAEALLMPNFLAEMVQHEVKNRGKSKFAATYTTCSKEAFLYLFTLMGRSAYEVLHVNLPKILPSLSTIKRLLSSKASLEEGEFRFDFIAAEILRKGEQPFVICSEDDTKISERIVYDSASDQIMGLLLPLDDGIPTRGSFKFTTLKAVQDYTKANPLSTYAKLMTIRSLTPNSTTHHLVIYGTKGSDKATDIRMRWEYVCSEFLKLGIIVLCELLNLILKIWRLLESYCRLFN